MEYFFYRIIIFIHVLSVISSIGPFFILLAIVRKLKAASETELHTYLDIIKFVVRLSKHSGHVLVATGVLLVILGPWTWNTPWIAMTLIIMVCSIFFLARAFTPTLRKFNETSDRISLVSKLRRTIWTYLILLTTMLWFMVVKPNFW